MTERLSPFRVVRAHASALYQRKYGKTTTRGRFDWLAAAMVYLPPLIVAGVAWKRGWDIAAVDPLLGAAALLVGGLLAALAQVASWRDRLTARQENFERADAPRRDSLDECVAHILMLVYVATLLVVLLAVGANVTVPASDAPDAPMVLPGGLSIAVCGVGVYALTLVLLIVPRLWDTYSDLNEVPQHMGGNTV